jgi:putative peptidoglycan lipid II flippase
MEPQSKALESHRPWQRWLAGGIGAFTIINGLVACCAFLKDVLLATYLGTSNEADAWTLAYFLPDTIGSNLLAAALNVACIPVFSALYVKGRLIQLKRTARNSLFLYTGLALAGLLLLYCFSGAVTNLLASSSSSELAHLTQASLLLMLPIIALYPLIAIGNALLQTFGSFKWYAAVPMLPHIVLIAVIAGCYAIHLNRSHALSAIGAAVGVGVAAMAATVWVGVWRVQRRRKISGADSHVNTTKYGGGGDVPAHADDRLRAKASINFALYLLILLGAQIVYLVERRLSASLEIGTVAGLNYAFRLSQLPIWVFAAAIYSVALPSLSQDIALNRIDNIRRTTAKAVHQLLAIAVPTTLFLFFMRTAVVSVLFERGAFNEESVRITGGILQSYSLSIAGLSVAALGQRYFMAAGTMLVPLFVSLASSAVNVAADYWLIQPLQGAGLGYGAAVGATVNALLLFLMLSFKLRYSSREIWRPFGKILVANVPVAVLLFICARLWPHMEQTGWLLRAAALATVIIGGAATYGIGLLKTKPLQSL